MKFSTRQDTDLSPEVLFDTLGDFDRLERVLIRRGASVQRVDPAKEPGVGKAWDIQFDWKGKRRDMRMSVTRFDRPEVITLEGVSDMFEIAINMEFIALARTKSRLQFEADVRPRSMKARLLIQTAKLGKAQLDRKFALRIAEFLGEVTRAAAA